MQKWSEYADMIEIKRDLNIPETLLKTVNAVNPARVIIEEVQKVPRILDVVHKIMEKRKDTLYPDRFRRSLAGNEVDFMLYGGKTITAVEVKNTKVLRPTD